MPINQLNIRVRRQPGLVTIDLEGDINTLAEHELNVAYAEATNDNPAAILLNFTQVNYINSSGLALIVDLLVKARRSNCRLLAYGLSKHYQTVFHITHLDDFINIFPDEATALANALIPS